MNMEKKEYMKPAMRVVRTLQMNVICGSGTVTSLNSGSTGLKFGGVNGAPTGSNGHARSRDLGLDDEEW